MTLGTVEARQWALRSTKFSCNEATVVTTLSRHDVDVMKEDMR